MEQFVCLKCSGSELIYEKWVKCREKVIIHPTGHVEYYDQVIDDIDIFPIECRFICGSCGEQPMLYGDSIADEYELRDYLKMTIDERAKMQAEYDQLMIDQSRIIRETSGE